ncbi:nitrate reductase (NADH), putative [Acanthamoeba castellanii str. Neff]|uniref:Nitrate reductase (NADH), putative n=1 Tax=Acanthamoeba castellanii (strain ATCC 30010 / Neff) TaxID=1257118 RepID=L8GMP0_ACACF|nr:nitrate reductase (NADH), putative [Acanthamoeba castellanii str. Neff]ELR14252.1 nitrate reductase (NADH), putative [Acanthamoeba castellanii str. Neff]
MRHLKVRSLMVPPGVPDFFTRVRLVEEGNVKLKGRVWAGPLAVKQVLVSVDGGVTWAEATLAAKAVGNGATRAGAKHFLMTKAIDELGNAQDNADEWNYYAMGATVPQSWRITGKPLPNPPRHPKL